MHIRTYIYIYSVYIYIYSVYIYNTFIMYIMCIPSGELT